MTDDKFDVYFSNGGDGGLYNLNYEINNHVTIVSNLRKMKKLREKIIREMQKGQKSTEKSRMNLFDELGPLISNWKGQYPDLGKLFRRKEMDWLLMKYVQFIEMKKAVKTSLLSFVIKCGYKDKPDVDEGGKPLLRRTTPVHYAGERQFFHGQNTVQELFKIYDRFDVNYSDDNDVTHLHVACKNGHYDVVEKFLELGQDPNCLSQKFFSSPLHLALFWKKRNVAELLLKNGANPNLLDVYESTPLHAICWREYDDDLAELFFKLCDDRNLPLQVDPRDKFGYTPLHLAVYKNNKKAVELLLKRGADPNVANVNGTTPLHLICKNENIAADMAETLFSICDDRHQLVEVDAKDKTGRTPLQWAVAKLRPNLVDILLDHGAKLINFVFPPCLYFVEFVTHLDEASVHKKLKIIFDVRAVVQSLEKKGYKLKLKDVQTITTLLDEYGLFEKLTNLDRRWYDKEEFSSKAKTIEMSPSQSLYDLVRSPPAKAKEILPNEDYYHELVSSTEWSKLPEEFRIASVAQLCEIIARGFLYKRRALASLVKLTGNKLPILCYEMIIEPLTNKDLWHIYLASSNENKRSQ